ncbi:DUF6650 family protein [Actinoplanes sp. ATCC 53533]|uniref:DUF6650 family protein n=1 Tax=Actinoplanes sp. ATCC 53533 TaxID=1288362 RepID=UPI000F79CF3A|nr:DUF6650 family protein [Actinoplanes sp. ATCC 53533]
MSKRLTGIQIPPGWGASWETIEGDKEVARKVITFLEDRRLLFGTRHWGQEDGFSCVRSALTIRSMLSEQLSRASPGKTLEQHLRAMRAACRRFVDEAGHEAEGFVNPMHFGAAIGDLRTSVGYSIAAIADHFQIPVEEELATILPPEDDPSWIPGFEDDEG